VQPPSNGSLPRPDSYFPASDFELGTSLSTRGVSAQLSSRGGPLSSRGTVKPSPRGGRRSGLHSTEATASKDNPAALLSSQLDCIFRQRGGTLLHKYKCGAACSPAGCHATSVPCRATRVPYVMGDGVTVSRVDRVVQRGNHKWRCTQDGERIQV
jgi:hypothetical protein